MFLKNKERDIAIIALFLLSGVRIAEVVNLDVADLNVETMRLSVTRKDGKKDNVPIAKSAKPYLVTYLELRKQNTQTESPALFLRYYKQNYDRISTDAITSLDTL